MLGGLQLPRFQLLAAAATKERTGVALTVGWGARGCGGGREREIERERGREREREIERLFFV